MFHDDFHLFFTANAEQMHSPSAGDLHTEVLMIDGALLDPPHHLPPPPPFKLERTVSMQHCQHHEWCY